MEKVCELDLSLAVEPGEGNVHESIMEVHNVGIGW